jgi:hypothetical protein
VRNRNLICVVAAGLLSVGVAVAVPEFNSDSGRKDDDYSGPTPSLSRHRKFWRRLSVVKATAENLQASRVAGRPVV